MMSRPERRKVPAPLEVIHTKSVCDCVFRRKIEIVDLRRGGVVEVREGRQAHRLPNPCADAQLLDGRPPGRKAPQRRCAVGREADARRSREVEPPPLFGMAQPEVARTARLGVRIAAVRPGERFAEIRAVNMVEGPVGTQRGLARRPIAVGPRFRTRIVRVVTVHRRSARPVVAVEILPPLARDEKTTFRVESDRILPWDA